ncbi:recombinase family protein [Tumebacillus avium]|uniref:recombinase family protein n=1 Tax=Tumebacillus avium TaxID=1903704 RepID=UPI001E4984E0|nr:recombinase family protein [Tumebacillus avium]
MRHIFAFLRTKRSRRPVSTTRCRSSIASSRKKGWDLHDFYIDVETGTHDKRDSLKRLIEDAEQKKFDCILAKELSRLARNGELSYKIRRVLEENRIHIITLDGAINTLEGNTDKFGLYAWLYEEESRRISKRIKVVFRQMAKRGEFKGSIPPYGYNVHEKRLYKRTDETVEAVRLIFQLYLEGKGIESIAKEMDARGYPTPGQVSGRKNAGVYWQGTSVKLILQNPHYVGDLVQGRSQTRSVTSKVRDTLPQDEWIVIKDAHEPIISREDFEAVQALMKNRYVKRPKAKKHLFTNYLYCADCGTALWYLQNRKAYVCGRFKKHGQNACTSHSMKEDHLTKLILSDLRELVNAGVDRATVLTRLELNVTKESQEKVKRVQKLEKEIEKLKAENRKFLKLLADDTISKDEYKEITEFNRNKVEELQRETVKAKKFANMQVSQKAFMQHLDKLLELDELYEAILQRLIARVDVGENQEITVQYRFADPV